GLDRRVLAADYHHALPGSPVRLVKPVPDVRQFLTRDVQEVGIVVVAGRDDQASGPDRGHTSARLDLRDDEISFATRADEANPGSHVERLCAHNTAVVR